MQTNSINEQKQLTSAKRPQQASTNISAGEIAALRDKIKNLGQDFSKKESDLAQDETLLATYQSTDRATLASEGITQKTIEDLEKTTNSIRSEVSDISTELNSDELYISISDHRDAAEENKSAYETALTGLVPEIKDDIKNDKEHATQIQKQFKHQIKVGQEAISFWSDEAQFWNKELNSEASSAEDKGRLGNLYSEMVSLENQINDLFGSNATDKKDKLKSELITVKDEISALRSRASA